MAGSGAAGVTSFQSVHSCRHPTKYQNQLASAAMTAWCDSISGSLPSVVSAGSVLPPGTLDRPRAYAPRERQQREVRKHRDRAGRWFGAGRTAYGFTATLPSPGVPGRQARIPRHVPLGLTHPYTPLEPRSGPLLIDLMSAVSQSPTTLGPLRRTGFGRLLPFGEECRRCVPSRMVRFHATRAARRRHVAFPAIGTASPDDVAAWPESGPAGWTGAVSASAR
jgi:hypothetical protein